MTKIPFMRRKNTNEATKGSTNSSNVGFGATPDWKYGLNWFTLMGVGVAFLMGLSGLFSVTVVLHDIQINNLWGWKGINVISVGDHLHKDSPIQSSQSITLNNNNLSGGSSAKEPEDKSQPPQPNKDNSPKVPTPKGTPKETEQEKETQSFDPNNDNSIGDLLPSGFSKDSCFSRYQSSSYLKQLPHKPSSSFLSTLRSYESLHKRCGPHTESYKKVVELITTSQQLDNSSDCNYLVLMSFSGLENRILSITSAFLYAMLTNRVLLIDRVSEIDDLFCEPFPGSSWLLPTDFPLNDQFDSFDEKSPLSYGNMLRNYIITDTTLTYPPYIYLHLAGNYDNYDKLFFCDRDHLFLHKVPWLIVKTDNYFIPSLFLMSSFEGQLNELFPRKDTVFRFLGRYLLHPTDSVWGLITRYYDTYLENADERVGIQIEGSDTDAQERITVCATQEGLLPQRSEHDGEVDRIGAKPKLKAVLLSSVSPGYYDSLKNTYFEKPTLTGEAVSFYHLSNNETQHTDSQGQSQNRKVLAEMYLLSMTDSLVTSSGSSFGYVAQGLGGHRPLILSEPGNVTVTDSPCHRAVSMEPCFLAAPSYLCEEVNGTDVGSVVRYVRHCEDISLGLKLVDN